MKRYKDYCREYKYMCQRDLRIIAFVGVIVLGVVMLLKTADQSLSLCWVCWAWVSYVVSCYVVPYCVTRIMAWEYAARKVSEDIRRAVEKMQADQYMYKNSINKMEAEKPERIRDILKKHADNVAKKRAKALRKEIRKAKKELK